MNHQSNLAAKVAARNNVHARLRGNAQGLFAAIRPFVGKKIKTTNGDFTQAFRNAVNSFVSGADFWLSSTYSLARVFKVSENGPRSSFYAEATLYIGEIDGQTLANVAYAEKFDGEAFRIDYNVEAVLKAREEVRAAREALNVAERGLAHFGEHDNG